MAFARFSSFDPAVRDVSAKNRFHVPTVRDALILFRVVDSERSCDCNGFTVMFTSLFFFHDEAI